MPSKNMLPKGKRRQSVKKEYREQRTMAQEREAEARAANEFGDPRSQNQDLGHLFRGCKKGNRPARSAHSEVRASEGQGQRVGV